MLFAARYIAGWERTSVRKRSGGWPIECLSYILGEPRRYD